MSLFFCTFKVGSGTAMIKELYTTTLKSTEEHTNSGVLFDLTHQNDTEGHRVV